MKHLYLILIPTLSVGVLLAQAPSAPQAGDAKPSEPPAIRSFDPAAMDTSVDPCVDFYQYACGNWMKSNPIPADQTRWARSFSQLRERDQYLLWKDLNAAADDPKTPLQKQYGDFFAACMDTATAEKKGLTPIEPSWAAIAKLSDPKQLAGLISDLENHGTPDGFFNFGVGVDEKDSTKQIAELRQAACHCPTGSTT